MPTQDRELTAQDLKKTSEEWCVALTYDSKYFPDLDEEIQDAAECDNCDSGVCMMPDGADTAGGRDMQFYYESAVDAREAVVRLRKIDKIDSMSLTCTTTWAIPLNAESPDSSNEGQQTPPT